VVLGGAGQLSKALRPMTRKDAGTANADIPMVFKFGEDDKGAVFKGANTWTKLVQ